MAAKRNGARRAVIFGCAGPELSSDERDFFRRVDPLGFILFARNCQTPSQVSALVGALRESVSRADAPVLIDQEGGRVQRLKPPHWRQAPPAAVFGTLFGRDPAAGREAARLNALLIASDLRALGIDVDCVPLLDVPIEGAHDVIGDRAFSRAPEVVAELGRTVALAMLEMGILPVIKHLPGHGRAGVDSHHSLPRVDDPALDLQRSDFLPFKALADMPWGMTAHVLYTQIDEAHPATTSPEVIARIVRGWIGFDGLLLSDDLSMQALGGTLGSRAASAIAAGCDVALHCNGKMDEMREIADVVPSLSPDAVRRVAAGRRRIADGAAVPDAATALEWRRRLDQLLAPVWPQGNT